MENFRKSLAIFALILALTPLAFGQATMTSTTLSTAVALGDYAVTVASASGISAPGSLNQPSTLLYVDKELMAVTSVSGTRIGVNRGRDGQISAHISGATVWVGTPSQFFNSDPVGACTSTSLGVLPYVVVPTGNVWNCVGGAWALQSGPGAAAGGLLGTGGTSVAVSESGAGREHVTKLTLSAATLISPGGAVNLAAGKLIYTLPAGAVVVKSASYSIALTNTGGVVNADTPDLGLGTTIGSGANTVLSGVGAAAENILTGQTVNNTTGTVENKTVADQVLVIEAAGDHTIYLNVADDWTGADTVKATGTVTIEWTQLN